MAKKENERLRLDGIRKLKLIRIGNSDRWMQNTSPVETSCEPPPPKMPRRIANVPKGPTPHHRPLTPSSKSPSVERSPYNGIGIHLNSPGFSLDGLLTPTSISPNEEFEIDPMDQIISTIVNWDAKKIIDPRYKQQAYHTNLAIVPPITFDTFDYYQKCVSFSLNIINRMYSFGAIMFISIGRL